MKNVLIIYLPYLLSLLTIWMAIYAGKKHPKTWLIGLSNQTLWSIWVVGTQQWGFLPLNIALWIIYYRNHRNWNTNG